MPQAETYSETPGPVQMRPVQRSHWWREVLVVAAFYGLYSLVRDLRGEQPVSKFQALTNAHRIIRLERFIGIFHESTVQHWFLSDKEFIKLCDDFYGSAHFIAAAGILILLFFRFPSHYRLWRNTLAFTTGLALIGFYFFPLMPPRLLPPQYHFVDTLQTIGGLWNFSSGAVSDVSNQYAAMPSLHTAWSAWCALVVITMVRPWWGKLALLYPAATIFCIVVTGNHYFADAIAGLALLGVSYFLARFVTQVVDDRSARREAAAESRLTPTGDVPIEADPSPRR